MDYPDYTTEHQKGKHLTYEDYVKIQMRLQDGWSANRIAVKELHCSPNTVRKIIRQGMTLLYHGKVQRFPWFREMPEPEDTQAYMALITALCEMAKNQKRVTATDKAPANEKYAFRCFLLRLGFIGDEYKAARKILLRNLTGNTAFRNGQPAKEEKPCE